MSFLKNSFLDINVKDAHDLQLVLHSVAEDQGS